MPVLALFSSFPLVVGSDQFNHFLLVAKPKEATQSSLQSQIRIQQGNIDSSLKRQIQKYPTEHVYKSKQR